MAKANKGMESQLTLLAQNLVQALSNQEGQQPQLLAFDQTFGSFFQKAGHKVLIRTPSNPSPKNKTFDLILVVKLLECVSEDKVILAQIKNLLSPDGSIIIAVPLAAQGKEPQEGCYRHYSGEELMSRILRAGLKITQSLANGPEFLIVECKASDEIGAELVSSVAKDVAQQQWDKAEEKLAAETEQMQDEAVVREYAMLIGHVHLARGRLSSALEAFNDASNLGSPSPLPLTAMGAVALSANDLEAASELFKAALEICPTHFAALRGMGFVQESLGDKESALTHFDMAAGQRPNDREIAEKVVRLAIDVGRADPAKHAIERHVKLTNDKQWSDRLLEQVAPLQLSENTDS